MKTKRLSTRKDSKLFKNGRYVQACVPPVIKRDAKLKAGQELDWDVVMPGTVIRVTKVTVLATVKEEQQQYEVVTLNQ